MSKVRICVSGLMSNFDVYVDDRKLEPISKKRANEFIYEPEHDKKNYTIKFIQGHICDYSNWFFRGILEFFLGLLGGVGGYSDSEEYRGPYRAYCEGVIDADKDVNINVKLIRKRKMGLLIRDKFNFEVNSDTAWKEIRNEFESPDYIRKRWNIIRIPYLILFVLIIGILILAFV